MTYTLAALKVDAPDSAIDIENDAATARIAFQGAHMLSYIPKNGEELIWASPANAFEEGVPLRGGVPVCWPWFSKMADHPELPQHGFARISRWSLADVKELDARTTAVTLVLTDTPATRQYIDFPFDVRITYIIGDKLDIKLTTRNIDDKPMTLTQALHTYFNVADITKIAVKGFGGKNYFNKVTGTNCTMPGTIVIDQEVDTVFQDAPGPFEIEDPVKNRTIRVETTGSNSAIVWNPWIEKCAKMAGYFADSYKTFVCVETANAMADVRTLQPGETHTITATYTIR